MIAIRNLQISILVLSRDGDLFTIGKPSLDDALEALGGGFEEGLASDPAHVDVDESNVADGSAEDSCGFAGFSAVLVAAKKKYPQPKKLDG